MSENLLELVKKGESEEIEFKKSTAQLVKYIEQWGTGTNDMIAGCVNWGIPEPEFELVTGDLVVTIRKDIFTEEYLKNLGLSERQIKDIEYLKIKGKITTEEYMKINKFTSERTARNDIVDLVKMIYYKRWGLHRQLITYSTFGNIRQLNGTKKLEKEE